MVYLICFCNPHPAVLLRLHGHKRSHAIDTTYYYSDYRMPHLHHWQHSLSRQAGTAKNKSTIVIITIPHRQFGNTGHPDQVNRSPY